MEVEPIMTVISTVGFPIAAFLLMFWFVKSEIKSDRESHEAESQKNVEAINALSLVVTKLCEKIDNLISHGV